MSFDNASTIASAYGLAVSEKTPNGLIWRATAIGNATEPDELVGEHPTEPGQCCVVRTPAGSHPKPWHWAATGTKAIAQGYADTVIEAMNAAGEAYAAWLARPPHRRG